MKIDLRPGEVIQHYPTCSASYPEKLEGEAPQATTVIDMEDGTLVVQCVDCGAYIMVAR